MDSNWMVVAECVKEDLEGCKACGGVLAVPA